MAARKRKSGTSTKTPVRRSPAPCRVGRDKARGKAGAARRRATLPDSVLELDTMAHVRKMIRGIQDFPQPGVLFRDITPLLADPRGFHIVLDAIAERFLGEHIDAVVGIESRGFIFGGALAARLNTSFVPVRKPGKLPYRTDKVSYSLEYGESELEMHRDSLEEGESVVIVDDLLATGGTAAAAAELVHRQGAYVAAFAFVIELDSLGGRDRLLPIPVISIVHYD